MVIVFQFLFLQKVEGECGLENSNLIIMIWFFCSSALILKLSRDTQPFTGMQKDTEDSDSKGLRSSGVWNQGQKSNITTKDALITLSLNILLRGRDQIYTYYITVLSLLC